MPRAKSAYDNGVLADAVIALFSRHFLNDGDSFARPHADDDCVRAVQPFRRAGRSCVKPESRKNKKTGLLRAEKIYIFLSVLFAAR